MTGGMDNPVDVVLIPGGDRILAGTFLVQPDGGLRDGLIHAIHGKVHSVTEDHPRTDPDVMPVFSHLSSTAPCGLARNDLVVFGNDFKDNLSACCFNLRKVTRHVPSRDDATYKSLDKDFLVSTSDQDFHPTDVQTGADGSLIVVDTVGWYKLCCPTSQLDKPDVPGAICRLRRKGTAKVNDPRGLKPPWTAMAPGVLTKELDDLRPAVRQRAIKELAQKGADALPELRDTIKGMGWSEGRRNAVRAATQIDHPHARELVHMALSDQNDLVRLAALHSVSLWRNRDAPPALAVVLERSLGSQPPRRRRGVGLNRRQERRLPAPPGGGPPCRSRGRTLDHLCIDRDQRPE